MSRGYSVTIEPAAERQIHRERIWLHNHRGAHVADAFEAELRHALDLLAGCPEMGDAMPEIAGARHWFLLKSRFHVYYRVYPDAEAIRIVRIRHEKQHPLKR